MYKNIDIKTRETWSAFSVALRLYSYVCTKIIQWHNTKTTTILLGSNDVFVAVELLNCKK